MRKAIAIQRLQIVLQHYFIPHHLFSRLLGKLAHCRWGWVKNTFIAIFLRFYAVNMQEAYESNPYSYLNFNAFFTRTLRESVRPIASGIATVVSPVDGSLSEIGKIKTGEMLHAKSATLSLLALLGGDEERAKPFLHGDFISLYLAPKDYHRVHMPFTGTLKEMVHVPGKLFSVNPLMVNYIPGLFTQNERIVTLFETEAGPMAVVLVGAMIVASMSMRWAGVVTPPTARQVRCWNYSDDAMEIKRGEEMGHFQLGSTVLVIFPKRTVSWNNDITANSSVKMGQALARIVR